MYCNACETEKPKDEFYPYAQTECKSCKKERMRVYKAGVRKQQKEIRERSNNDSYMEIRPEGFTYSVLTENGYVGLKPPKGIVDIELDGEDVLWENLRVPEGIVREYTTDKVLYSIATWMDFSTLSMRYHLYAFTKLYFGDLMKYLCEDLTEYEKLNEIDPSFLYGIMMYQTVGVIQPSEANIGSMELNTDDLFEYCTTYEDCIYAEKHNMDLKSLTRHCPDCDALLSYSNRSGLFKAQRNGSVCGSCGAERRRKS